jgi:S1-C subfamily serine protease
LQVTTPISPGSSGGPLFNMAGEVVGITTMYLKGGENLNFAIPINDAKRLLSAESSKIQPLPNETT